MNARLMMVMIALMSFPEARVYAAAVEDNLVVDEWGTYTSIITAGKRNRTNGDASYLLLYSKTVDLHRQGQFS